jgi:hypothetical protein
MTELITARDSILTKLPPWLTRYWGIRLIYAIAIQVDALTEMAKQALLARFPGFNESATAELCRNRRVTRGPNETEAQITARLMSWLDDKRLLGHPVGIESQLDAFFLPRGMHFRIVFNNGNYWDSNDGTVTIGWMPWNWDGHFELFARFWLLLWTAPTSDPLSQGDVWVDDGTFGDDDDVGDGGVVGIGALTDDVTGTAYGTVQGIQQLVHAAGSGNIRHMDTVVIFDNTEWEAQEPDGTWDIMSHRNPNCSYLAGNRVYE